MIYGKLNVLNSCVFKKLFLNLFKHLKELWFNGWFIYIFALILLTYHKK